MAHYIPNFRDVLRGLAGLDADGNVMSLKGLVLRPAGDGFTYIYDRDSGKPVLRLMYVDENNYKLYLLHEGTWTEILFNEAGGIPLLDSNGELDFARLMGSSKEYFFDDFYYLNTNYWTSTTGGGGTPEVVLISGLSGVALDVNGAINSYANLYSLKNLFVGYAGTIFEFQFALSSAQNATRIGMTNDTTFTSGTWLCVKYDTSVDTTMKIEYSHSGTVEVLYDTGIVPNASTRHVFRFACTDSTGGVDVYIDGVKMTSIVCTPTTYWSSGFSAKIKALDTDVHFLKVYYMSFTRDRI